MTGEKIKSLSQITRERMRTDVLKEFVKAIEDEIKKAKGKVISPILFANRYEADIQFDWQVEADKLSSYKKLIVRDEDDDDAIRFLLPDAEAQFGELWIRNKILSDYLHQFGWKSEVVFDIINANVQFRLIKRYKGFKAYIILEEKEVKDG